MSYKGISIGQLFVLFSKATCKNKNKNKCKSLYQTYKSVGWHWQLLQHSKSIKYIEAIFFYINIFKYYVFKSQIFDKIFFHTNAFFVEFKINRRQHTIKQSIEYIPYLKKKSN